MLPITNLKYQQSWAKPLDDFDMEMETAEIEEPDTIARKNLETTFCIVPKSMVRHAVIEYIYWKQERTTIPHVPHDMQLEWYLKNFSKVCDRTLSIIDTHVLITNIDGPRQLRCEAGGPGQTHRS